jgi:hypothetical protein
LYWKELEDTWKAGHSVLLYQHFPFKKREDFIGEIAANLRARISVAEVVAFRTPFVVFFLLVRPEHNHLANRASDVERVWGKQVRVAFHPARN